MADLTISIDLNASGVTAGERRVRSSVASIKESFRGIAASAASFVGNVAAGAFQSLTAQIIQTAKALVNYSSQLEQTNIAFETLMGNAVLARKHLADLRQFAVDTPFEFPGLAKASQRLQGVGVAAEKVIPLLKDIGNVVSATGEVSEERFQGITNAISQMISKTIVSAEEMEQLAERGVPGWKILSEAVGKTQAEVRQLAEDGRITSDVMVQALQRISQQKFGDAMQKQSRTFAGAMSTIRDVVQQTAARAFAPFYERISKLALETSKRIQAQKGDFNKTGAIIGQAIGEGIGLTIVTALKAAFNDIVTKPNSYWATGDPGVFWSAVFGIARGSASGLTGTPTETPVGQQVFDYSRPQDRQNIAAPPPIPLPGTGGSEDELAAQIALYSNHISQVEKTYEEAFKKITDAFKETANVAQYQQAWDQLKQWYGEQINELVPKWDELVEKQTLAEKDGQFQRLQIYQETQQRIQELGNLTLAMDDEAAKALREVQKRASDQEIKEAIDKFSRLDELAQSYVSKELAKNDFLAQSGYITELQAIEKRNALELKYLESKRAGLTKVLEFVKGNAEQETSIKHQLAVLDNEIAEQQITNAARVQKAQQDALKAYSELVADMDREILELNHQLQFNTELTKANEVAQLLLTDAYKNLTQAQKDDLLAKAQQVDALREALKAQEEAQRAYDEFYSSIRDSLDVLANEGFGAFFKNVYRKFQDFLLDMVAEWLTSKFFQMFFKGGNQQTAAANGQGGGTIFDAIRNAIFGPGAGNGPGGTPNFNPNIGNILNRNGTGSPLGGGGPAVGPGLNRPGFNPNSGSFPSSGGGLAGTIGLLGSGAMILGGAIGGRTGGFLSNIGMGVALGAQIGSIIPGIGTVIGAAIGAAGGFLASLFGGDPKRKRDKKEKIPTLNKGFTDALQQLRDLIRDTRSLRVDPESALAKATELRSAIAGGFDIQFESKKYRKEAQKLIQSKLREADALIEELRTAAEISRAAGERQQRLLPEFANGVFMSPAFNTFRRQNGMLAGQWTGRDVVPAMLARGEMVLNPGSSRKWSRRNSHATRSNYKDYKWPEQFPAICKRYSI